MSLGPILFLRQCVRHLSTRRITKGRLVDRVRIYVRGGGGGQGAPRVGGVGGDGGDVLVKAVEGGSLSVLARMERRRFIAGSGEHWGRGRGRRGRDAVVSVPPGTVVYKEDGAQQLCDLDCAGCSEVLVRGGRGGGPPSYQGRQGERGVFTLELKLIADVGLVGFPNAGKSTLLRALSKATPKVASYPFTTIRPHLGVMSCDPQPITVADLPGLVEGAHANVGMGLRFLRHVERTKVLVYVVDVCGFQLSEQHQFRDAFETVCCLTKELESYHRGLCEWPSVLVVNKMDKAGAEQRLGRLVSKLSSSSNTDGVSPLPLPQFSQVVPISAATHTGVEGVRASIRAAMEVD